MYVVADEVVESQGGLRNFMRYVLMF